MHGITAWQYRNLDNHIQSLLKRTFMAAGGPYGETRCRDASSRTTESPEDQRLDPRLERLPSGASSTPLPTYLFIGLPICFALALGIILIGFRGAVTIESAVFLGLGCLGILSVRRLNRQ